MPEPQSDTEYRVAIQAAVVAARLLAHQDLPAILAAMNRAEAIGSILNPTLWIEKSQAMQEDKELLQAALPLWRFSKKLLASDEEAA